jgi:hypothetical protein
MLQTIVTIPVLVLAAWCLWVRREAWRRGNDRTIALAIGLHGAGYLLCIPLLGCWLGGLLFHLTGMTHIRDYLGHLCFIAASTTIITVVAARLMPDNEIERFMRRVEIPNAFAAGGMLLCLLGSDTLRHLPISADFFEVHPDGWLRAYWLIFAAANVQMVRVFLELLWALREDPRNYTTATLLIASARVWCIAFVVIVINATSGTVSSLWVWIPICISSGLALVGIGQSHLHREGVKL